MKKPERRNCIQMIALFLILSGLQSIFGTVYNIHNTPDSAILIQDKKGVWHCLWNLNENDGAFAHASPHDPVSWKRQSYPEIIANDNCLLIETGYNTLKKHYFISWISNKENDKIYAITTTDFKNYTVSWNLIENLINAHRLASYNYQPPGWFIHNQDYYDKYNRNKSKVYHGEYAVHLPGRPNNIETALAEALYLTSLERNGDIANMTSYAPLLAKEGYTQWNPDLIYFNNTEVKPIAGYYVQLLYGQNAGDRYVKHTASLSEKEDAIRKRIGVSVVKDSNNNDLIIKLVNLRPVSVKTRNNLMHRFQHVCHSITSLFIHNLPYKSPIRI